LGVAGHLKKNEVKFGSKVKNEFGLDFRFKNNFELFNPFRKY